jgi:hypothetical protein
MDLGFDSKTLHNGGFSDVWTGVSSPALDWHELLPRLLASWSARRELLHLHGCNVPRRGNFDPASAHALAKFEHGSRAVNQSTLGNRKPDGGITVGQAGNSQPGTRG